MEKKISLAMLFCFLASIPIALFFPDFMLKSKPLGDYFLIILKSFVLQSFGGEHLHSPKSVCISNTILLVGENVGRFYIICLKGLK